MTDRGVGTGPISCSLLGSVSDSSYPASVMLIDRILCPPRGNAMVLLVLSTWWALHETPIVMVLPLAGCKISGTFFSLSEP